MSDYIYPQAGLVGTIKMPINAYIPVDPQPGPTPGGDYVTKAEFNQRVGDIEEQLEDAYIITSINAEE